MNSAPRAAVATAMTSVFDRLQALPKHVQLLALAGAFTLMVETAKLAPQDAMSSINRLMFDPLTSTRREARFDAMRYHLETELLKEGR